MGSVGRGAVQSNSPAPPSELVKSEAMFLDVPIDRRDCGRRGTEDEAQDAYVSQ